MSCGAPGKIDGGAKAFPPSSAVVVSVCHKIVDGLGFMTKLHDRRKPKATAVEDALSVPEKFIAVLENDREIQSMYASSRPDGGWAITTKRIFQESAGEDIEFIINEYQISFKGELLVINTLDLTYQCPFCTIMASSFCDCPLSYRREFLPVVSSPRRSTVQSFFDMAINLGNLRANVVSITQALGAPPVTHRLVAVGNASRPTRETHEIIQSNFFCFEGTLKIPSTLVEPGVVSSCGFIDQAVIARNVRDFTFTEKPEKKKMKRSNDHPIVQMYSLKGEEKPPSPTVNTEGSHCPATITNRSSIDCLLQDADGPDEVTTQQELGFNVQAQVNHAPMRVGANLHSSSGYARTEGRTPVGSVSVLESSASAKQLPIYMAQEIPPESVPGGSASSPIRTLWDKPSACPVCEKVFRRRVDMDRHLRTYHSEDRSHRCGQCSKAFKHAYHLTQHIASLHSEVDMLHCPHDQCKYKSKRKADITRHQKRHSNV
mmetsp:Transcript_16578/g.42713  ORF Transcript_16578/g.42713 Transcript_16578/m.42713 type:complete len:488 (-) Transcript_16578:60-1523(-)|eukprot:CAMPEP_0184717966 /NCGR_PEP_ID=MMETSP0314-20130426/7284_1 /TAXON_ID=38298 /ORGANISM="Rhodella maculata, Strain CCMP 736" /LENGTH=487 /DNA_ID=CAMNT_0027181623 /DNA_START=9 /DNA_END=1472 /DNA_ORIENTATION=+